MARLGRTCLFCLLAVARLDAVAQRTLPDGYTRRVWQTQDGLPESTVQAFAQTSDHYLWIGTSGGLVRFDGARFVVFDRENTPQIHENSIFCLTVSRDGSLWAGSDGGGLVRYRNGNEVTFSVEGEGILIGVDNGNPRSHEDFKSNRRRAFNGLCLAIVQSTARAGHILVTAASPSLKSTSVTLTSRT